MLLGYHAQTIAPPGPPVPGLPLKKAAAFESGGKTPQELFSHHASEHTVMRCHQYAHRFVRRGDDREMLIYVDGSCLDQNDTANVQTRRAGCAWVFKPVPYTDTERRETIRLEKEGPTGQEYPQTSNRAELRAALGALQYRCWYGEGWQRMVIATDSEYLILGITDRIQGWVEAGWKLKSGKPVKNRDLWQVFLDRINDCAEHGTQVIFWQIPRELNAEADAAAKIGASLPAVQKYTLRNGTYV